MDMVCHMALFFTTLLKGVPKKLIWLLEKQMPDTRPYVFMYGDLVVVNTIIEDGSLAGIFDWEANGYFPVW